MYTLKLYSILLPWLIGVEWDHDCPCRWWWGWDMGWQRYKVAAEVNPGHASHTHCLCSYANYHATAQSPLNACILLIIVYFYSITFGFYVIHVYCKLFWCCNCLLKILFNMLQKKYNLIYSFNGRWLGIYSYLSHKPFLIVSHWNDQDNFKGNLTI